MSLSRSLIYPVALSTYLSNLSVVCLSIGSSLSISLFALVYLFVFLCTTCSFLALPRFSLLLSPSVYLLVYLSSYLSIRVFLSAHIHMRLCVNVYIVFARIRKYMHTYTHMLRQGATLWHFWLHIDMHTHAFQRVVRLAPLVFPSI